MSDLECVRGDRRLFSGLSFSLTPGTLLHIRGENGRGKTTLLRTVCGLSSPAHGRVSWNGMPITAQREEYQSNLAYIGHQNGIQGELTAEENLIAAARLHGIAVALDAVRRVLADLALDAVAALPAKLLSQGQKRRVALARLALIPKPLWVLDEPLTALDAGSLARVNALLDRHLANAGMIALVSHQALGLGRHIAELDLDRCAPAPA